MTSDRDLMVSAAHDAYASTSAARCLVAGLIMAVDLADEFSRGLAIALVVTSARPLTDHKERT